MELKILSWAEMAEAIRKEAGFTTLPLTETQRLDCVAENQAKLTHQQDVDKPTEEQIGEFWKWCGFKTEYKQFAYQLGTVIRPDGKRRDDLPLIELNNLFSYAVPKLRETYNDLRVVFTYTTVNNCTLSYWGKRYSRKKNFEWLTLGGHTDGDSAFALFWAIWAVIQEGKVE